MDRQQHHEPFDRRDPDELVAAGILEADDAIVLKVVDDQWMKLADVQLTLRNRDKHRWTPDHVAACVARLLAAQLLMTIGMLEPGVPPNHVQYRRRNQHGR